MSNHKVGILTAGGLAPCLSSAIGGLIQRYTEVDPGIEILCYRDGYKGLLQGKHIAVDTDTRDKAATLHLHGGSPIGNSRVKLTNVDDCVKRGLIKEGDTPLDVAAEQLQRDGITILHTVGGDDTNTMAAALAQHLADHNYDLTVVGLPKTVDNDISPIQQTLGAQTAAEQGAIFFENVVNEFSANPRMLIIHEVMGRRCGWLTAATAASYRERLDRLNFVPQLGLTSKCKDVHAIYLPEMKIDLRTEAIRLRKMMDEIDCINIFLSEGAGVECIIEEMEASGEEIPRDAFGHVRLNEINPGQWFGKRIAEQIGAEKVLVQKSGYFARSAAANEQDLQLIQQCVQFAITSALNREPGVIGHDEERDGELRCIEFPRIRGGKSFSCDTPWFAELLKDIGQPG